MSGEVFDVAEELGQALERPRGPLTAGAAPPDATITGSPSKVWDSISRLRSLARREILSVDDTTYLLSGQVPESIQLRGPATLRAAIRRGVTVRQVTSRAGLLADTELGAIVYRDGGHARVAPQVPMKVTVIDRRLALLPLDSTVLANGFRVIRDRTVVSALVAFHRNLWRTGEDPDAVIAHDHGARRPPPHLAQVLPTLAFSGSDEAAARTLGISPRSYSRRVAELMTVLGARNRFQAGAEATRRGWL
jgi:hypothetical protein